jgi:hypothetical protein
MAERLSVAWVAPVASLLAVDRAEVIAFARSAPVELWERASVVDGWLNRDILAHLAGGNDLLLQRLLHSAVTGEPPDPAVFSLDTDAENTRGVAERRAWSIRQLIEELERDGAEVQTLFAQLAEDDRDRRWDGFPITLGRFLQIVEEERHDHEHLEQLRAARRLIADGR